MRRPNKLNHVTRPEDSKEGPKGFRGTNHDIDVSNQIAKEHLAATTGKSFAPKPKGRDPFATLGNDLKRSRPGAK